MSGTHKYTQPHNQVIKVKIIIPASLEETRIKLARDNSMQNHEREKQQLAELQAKREHSAVAFQQDMAKYLASGSIPTG